MSGVVGAGNSRSQHSRSGNSLALTGHEDTAANSHRKCTTPYIPSVVAYCPAHIAVYPFVCYFLLFFFKETRRTLPWGHVLSVGGEMVQRRAFSGVSSASKRDLVVPRGRKRIRPRYDALAHPHPLTSPSTSLTTHTHTYTYTIPWARRVCILLQIYSRRFSLSPQSPLQLHRRFLPSFTLSTVRP